MATVSLLALQAPPPQKKKKKKKDAGKSGFVRPNWRRSVWMLPTVQNEANATLPTACWQSKVGKTQMVGLCCLPTG